MRVRLGRPLVAAKPVRFSEFLHYVVTGLSVEIFIRIPPLNLHNSWIIIDLKVSVFFHHLQGKHPRMKGCEIGPDYELFSRSGELKLVIRLMNCKFRNSLVLGGIWLGFLGSEINVGFSWQGDVRNFVFSLKGEVIRVSELDDFDGLFDGIKFRDFFGSFFILSSWIFFLFQFYRFFTFSD